MKAILMNAAIRRLFAAFNEVDALWTRLQGNDRWSEYVGKSILPDIRFLLKELEETLAPLEGF